MALRALQPTHGLLVTVQLSPREGVNEDFAKTIAEIGAYQRTSVRGSSFAKLAAAAAAAAAVAAVAPQRRKRGKAAGRLAGLSGSEGAPRRTRTVVNYSGDAVKTAVTEKQTATVPKNLYQLLNIRPTASEDEIKKAYYSLQKICHPDVAGEDAADMCILLNDAYEVLSNKSARREYDAKIGHEEPVEVSTDLAPTWTWKPWSRKRAPQWTGRPMSRSAYGKVKPEDRGERWHSQQFLFVDEYSCITCRNCCDVSGRTFAIDIEHGRARVYSQWTHSEEFLNAAVQSCPVECIHWVTREELQVLEYVTRNALYKEGCDDVCPMAVRQGMAQPQFKPFEAMDDFMAKKEQKQALKDRAGAKAADLFEQRIEQAFGDLAEGLKLAGWGSH
mmetsp:Transcript_1369/g.3677  ORF Transcript_1369/g.3677 Transcript_1369/m.3677 type:complete len:388 (-) Transcript_1369:131-1294(-)